MRDKSVEDSRLMAVGEGHSRLKYYLRALRYRSPPLTTKPKALPDAPRALTTPLTASLTQSVKSFLAAAPPIGVLFMAPRFSTTKQQPSDSHSCTSAEASSSDHTRRTVPTENPTGYKNQAQARGAREH